MIFDHLIAVFGDVLVTQKSLIKSYEELLVEQEDKLGLSHLITEVGAKRFVLQNCCFRCGAAVDIQKTK